MRVFARNTKGRESGLTLVETLIALAVLGVIAVAFLSGLATAYKGNTIASEQAVAESLARSEVEYVKGCPYEYLATDYPVDPTLTLSTGWNIPLPTVSLMHDADDGIQKITVTVYHNGRAIYSVVTYKVDR